jgi:hypothetical protein
MSVTQQLYIVAINGSRPIGGNFHGQENLAPGARQRRFSPQGINQQIVGQIARQNVKPPAVD